MPPENVVIIASSGAAAAIVRRTPADFVLAWKIDVDDGFVMGTDRRAMELGVGLRSRRARRHPGKQEGTQARVLPRTGGRPFPITALLPGDLGASQSVRSLTRSDLIQTFVLYVDELCCRTASLCFGGKPIPAPAGSIRNHSATSNHCKT